MGLAPLAQPILNYPPNYFLKYTQFIVYVFATLACDLTSITTATPTYTNEIQKLKVLNEGNLIHFQLNENNIAENSSRPKLQNYWVAFAR